jgi:hypothetical protein
MYNMEEKYCLRSKMFYRYKNNVCQRKRKTSEFVLENSHSTGLQRFLGFSSLIPAWYRNQIKQTEEHLPK